MKPVPRRRLSHNEYLAMYLRQRGVCGCSEECDLLLIPGEIHQQHDPPHELRKFDPDYNGKPDVLYTEQCHKRITAERDGPNIVKARHMGGGKGSQRAKRKNKSYRQIKSRNTLGGDEYKRRKAWAEKARKE